MVAKVHQTRQERLSFTVLPLEIRTMIYKLALIDTNCVIAPYLTSYEKRDGMKSGNEVVKTLGFGLLSCNRQIRSEASDYFYGFNIFHFTWTEPCGARHPANAHLPAFWEANKGRFRQVQITFHNRDLHHEDLLEGVDIYGGARDGFGLDDLLRQILLITWAPKLSFLDQMTLWSLRIDVSHCLDLSEDDDLVCEVLADKILLGNSVKSQMHPDVLKKAIYYRKYELREMELHEPIHPRLDIKNIIFLGVDSGFGGPLPHDLGFECDSCPPQKQLKEGYMSQRCPKHNKIDSD